MKPTTNIEMLVDLMEFSDHGALTQMFVIDAVTKHAEAVAGMTDAQVEEAEAKSKNPLISMHAWRDTAREVKQKIDAFYARRDL